MDLQDWAENGVDISVFLDDTLIWDEDTLVGHGDAQCDDLVGISTTRMYQGRPDAQSEICDECWEYSLSGESRKLYLALSTMYTLDYRLYRGRLEGPRGVGLPALLGVWSALPGHEGVSQWRVRMRGEILGLVGSETPEVDPREEVSLLVVRSVDVLRGLSKAHLSLLAPWWTRQEGRDVVFQGPRGAIWPAYVELTGSAPLNEFGFSCATLQEGDDERVVETALGLWDPESTLLLGLNTALDAARRV